jgi:adenosylhomocysteine nucleosidase
MIPRPALPDDDPSAWRCDVGVVFALAAEEGGLADLLADMTTIDAAGFRLRHGRIAERHVTTIVAGPGAERAAEACEVLFQGHRPRRVISAGFCGGLVSSLPPEAIVVADTLHGDAEASEYLAAQLESLPADALPRPSATGRFVQVERIVARAADKRKLAEETGAIACDMETLAVVRACLKRRVPVAAVRVVSDTADEDLPPDLERLMQPRTTAGTLGVVVGTLWRRPSSAKDLWRLKERALAGSTALGKYLARLVTALPIDAAPAADAVSTPNSPS